MSSIVAGIRLEEEKINELKKIAAQKSVKELRTINYNDLIRDAIDQVYFQPTENESNFDKYLKNFDNTAFDANFNEEFLFTDSSKLSYAQMIIVQADKFITEHSQIKNILTLDELKNNAKAIYDLPEGLGLSVNYKKQPFILESQNQPVPTNEISTLIYAKLHDIKKGKRDIVNKSFKDGIIKIIRDEEALLHKVLNFAKESEKDFYVADDVNLYITDKSSLVISESNLKHFAGKIYYNSGISVVNLNELKDRTRTSYFEKTNCKIYVTNDFDFDGIALIEKDSGCFVQDSSPTILPADDPMQLRIGWVIYEQAGVIIDYSTIKFFKP